MDYNDTNLKGIIMLTKIILTPIVHVAVFAMCPKESIKAYADVINTKIVNSLTKP